MVTTKARLQKLAGIINESTNESLQEMLNEQARVFDDSAKELIFEVPAWLRAIHLWFHSAHHVTRGPNFAGDHVELYGRIYEEVQAEVDGVIEKAVGVTGGQDMACPMCLTKHAMKIMERYHSPVELKSSDIAKEGLRMIEDYLIFLNRTFKELDAKGMLSLGMNDQWAASANTHETYAYLLGQRVRAPNDTVQKMM